MSRYLIGIDPGRNIGLAVYDMQTRALVCVETYTDEIAAMQTVKVYHDCGGALVRVEDPARNKPVFARPGVSARGMMKIAQNVGANKQMAEDFIRRLKLFGFDVQAVAPRRAGKVDAIDFVRLTGWRARCSQHARDAAMLVVGDTVRPHDDATLYSSLLEKVEIVSKPDAKKNIKRASKAR